LKKFFVLLLFIGMLFTPLTAHAITEGKNIQKDQVLDLNDCVQFALEHSHRIKQFQGYLKIAKSRVGQARSDYFPTIVGSTGYHYAGDYPQRGSSASDGVYSASTSLNQLIYNFGKTGARINMQKFYVLASKADLDNTVLQTIFGVRTNYYAVLAAKANVDIQKSYVQINERQYQRTKAYFEEGLKSKIDLVNAEVYLSEAKIALIEAQNAYDSAIIKLNSSMFNVDGPPYQIQNTETFNFKNNLVPVALKMISDKEPAKAPQKTEKTAVYVTSVEKTDILQHHVLKSFPYDFNQSVAMAKENRPDLKSLQSTYSAMEQALKYAQREFMPAISASAGYNFKDVSSNYNNAFNAGAYIDFPIINGMNTKYKIEEAKANLDIALRSIDTIEEDIYFEVQKAYIDMKKLESQVPLQQVKVKQTLENFELADGRYEVGLGNFIELQDAKVNYNDAQQAYVKTVYDYNVARAKLELAMAFIPGEIKTPEETK